MYLKAEDIIFVVILNTVVTGTLPKKINTSLADHYGYLVANGCQYNTEQLDDLPYAEGENFTVPENSIFFVETSCEGGLSFRQACSVESAARAHKNRQVNVLFTVPITKKRLKRRPLKALLTYPNVKFYRINLHKYGKGTPLKTMMRHDLLQSTKFIHHAADVLKFLTLYKFGGIFIDLDVITVKSFDTLPQSKTNFITKEDVDTLSVGVVALSNDRLGRILAHETVHLLKYDFNPHERIANGADLFKNVLKSVFKKYKFHVYTVNRNIIMELLDPGLNFAVYSDNYFHPIAYPNFEEYFLPGELNVTNIYGAHTWNFLSKFMSISEDSMYAKLAKTYCPKTMRLYRFKIIRKSQVDKLFEAKLTGKQMKLKTSKTI